jgi:hypothetical protein
MQSITNVELQIEKLGFMRNRFRTVLADLARAHDNIISTNSDATFDIPDIEAIGSVTYQQYLSLGESAKGNRAQSRRIATVYGRLYYLFLSSFGIHFSDHGLLKPGTMDSMLPSHLGVRATLFILQFTF